MAFTEFVVFLVFCVCCFLFCVCFKAYPKIFANCCADELHCGMKLLCLRKMVRAFTSGAVDLSLIPSRVKPMTLKLVFTASLLDAQH